MGAGQVDLYYYNFIVQNCIKWILMGSNIRLIDHSNHIARYCLGAPKMMVPIAILINKITIITKVTFTHIIKV